MPDSTTLNFVLQSSDNGEPWAINQKIFDILTACVQTDSIISLTNAAKEINKLFPLNRPKEDNKANEEPESFLLKMWGVVLDVAEQIPWKHVGQNILIEVFKALKDLPGPTAIQMDGWGKLSIWSDLPLLGPVMTEHGHEDTSDDQTTIRTRQRNFTAFGARLTQSGLADRSKNLSIHDFREAFEEEPDPRAKAYYKQGPRLDIYVPLVAI